MANKEVRYKLKQKKKISFFSKMKMKRKNNKLVKSKINAYEKEQAAVRKKVAQNADELLKLEKQRIKNEKKKEKEAQKIAQKIEKEKKARDKRILKEAEAHQRELQKAFAEEEKAERKRFKELARDEKLRLKQQENIRANERKKMREETSTKQSHITNQRKEYKEWLDATREEREVERKKKDAEYKKQRAILDEIRKAEEEKEKERKREAGITWKTILAEKIRRFSRYYSFKNLQETASSYGYEYTLNEFIIQSCAIIGIVLGVSYVSQLKGLYLAWISIIALLSIPFLIYAYFKQMYATKRFEMVQSYLSNVLPVFMQKPKFRYAIEEVRDMSSKQMRQSLNHALSYIDTNTDDENVVGTAMSFIEMEFPNSRIKSVHKLMSDIENGNSESYVDICENMYIDIEGWIRRVYNFQKELKSRRTSLLMLCGFSIILNTIFVYMYGTSEVFVGFTDKTLYQVSTFIFIAAVFIVMALVITMLHGGWLVDDSKDKDTEEKIKAYNYIHTHDGSIKKNDVIVSFIFFVGAFYMISILGNKMGWALIMLAAIFLFRSKMNYTSQKKKVSDTLMIEFPVWLRTVALNLNDMTVIVSMEKSMETCSFLMKKELDKFFEEYNENPTSIAAFNNFLSEYDIDDVQSSMKILYTIQSMSKEDVNNQVTIIIQRNQELLAKTEQMQNEESLGAAELLGYMPMILLTAQLIMSMVLMFLHIMEYMNAITATIG